MTATLSKWYEEHGRHEIFAGGKSVPLASTEHSLALNQEAVEAGAQTDLDELGVPKNAREEKIRARAKARPEKELEITTDSREAKYHERMVELYRQHVLGERATVQIQGLSRTKR